jgi:hypothetical protein
MSERDVVRLGGRVSIANALVTVAALGVGIIIVARSGAQSGMDVARLHPEQLRAMKWLLIIAELLKLSSALFLAIAAWAAWRRWRVAAWATASAYIAAMLVALAGLLGLVALAGGGPGMVPVIGLLGLASLSLTGIWAAMTSRSSAVPGHWVRLLGGLLAVIGFLAVALPPAGLAFGLLGIAWWLGIARQFDRVL